MMQGFGSMMDGMGWSMGIVSLLVLILIVLGIAALIKHLFSGNSLT